MNARDSVACSGDGSSAASWVCSPPLRSTLVQQPGSKVPRGAPGEGGLSGGGFPLVACSCLKLSVCFHVLSKQEKAGMLKANTSV